MGDRRIAKIKTEDGSLYFYTHWTGHSMVQDAQHALKMAEPRKGDDSYALRIVVDQMIKSAGSRDSTLNSGLMLKCRSIGGEDEYRGNPHSVVIDLTKWEVRKEVW